MTNLQGKMLELFPFYKEYCKLENSDNYLINDDNYFHSTFIFYYISPITTYAYSSRMFV